MNAMPFVLRDWSPPLNSSPSQPCAGVFYSRQATLALTLWQFVGIVPALLDRAQSSNRQLIRTSRMLKCCNGTGMLTVAHVECGMAYWHYFPYGNYQPHKKASDMRIALITMLFAFATNTASAAAPSAQDRTTVADSFDRLCQSVHFSLAMQEFAKAGATIPLEMQDFKTIPLDFVRSRLKGEPLDQQIVSGCDCVMTKWKKQAMDSRTKAELDAVAPKMAKYSETPAGTAHVHACMDKARAARGLPKAANKASN
jgi:hypothetical protein